MLRGFASAAGARSGAARDRAATIGWVRAAGAGTVGVMQRNVPLTPLEPSMHVTIEPAIHYFGTPVVLISTLNPDGGANLAPMSSAWWLRDRCLLGLDPTSRTVENLLRT